MKFAILFGGRSFEHEISIVSAISLSKKLSGNPVFIFLDKEGDFYFIPPNALKSKLFSSGDYASYPKINLKKGGFFQKGLFGENQIAFDVLLNLIHGREGEDGSIAALMDFFGIPYIGPRIEMSAISHNKLLTKHLAAELGIATLEYQLLKRDGDMEIRFDFPVILKPLRLGSSIGVSIVKSQEELNYALDVAYEFDTTVLVEPFKQGIREFNIAGCKTGENYQLSFVEEPEKNDFLDFEKKYLDFARTERAKKADIDSTLQQTIENTFATICDHGFEGALLRCDFFWDGTTIYLNEINPVPGSLSHYLFEDFEQVLLRLAKSLPRPKHPKIEYHYIHQIQNVKGK